MHLKTIYKLRIDESKLLKVKKKLGKSIWQLSTKIKYAQQLQ